MRNSNEQDISEVIRQLLDTYRLNTGLINVRIREAWAKLMEPAIVQRTSQLDFKNKVLSIYLNSAVLRQELLFKKEEIRQAINEELKEDAIREVQIY
jgi:hypothetical protein